MDSIHSNGLLVATVLVFVAVVLAVEAALLWWRGRHGGQARRLRRRLQAVASTGGAAASSPLKDGSAGEPRALERMLRARPGLEPVQALLRQSGLSLSLSGLLGACAACFFGGWLLMRFVLWQPVPASFVAACALALAPVFFIGWRRERRLGHIERQLPEALDLLSRAMRAGHGFTAGLQMAGEELPEPLAGELRATHDEITFGVSQPQALASLGERVPLTDMRYFVVSVMVQRESGGNLAEVMTQLAGLIRERHKLRAKVRVLSANGRFSGWVLVLLPFGLGALMNAFNPAFMSPLWTDPMGITMLKGMAALMALGIFLMRRIVRIRV